MRTSAFIIMGMVLAAQGMLAAPGYSQGSEKKLISLHLKDVSIQKVFSLIEAKADVVIMYENTGTLKNEKISISVREKRVSDVLDLLLNNKSLKWNIRENIIRVEAKDTDADHHSGVFMDNIFPPAPIRIQIIDSAGHPLPGITIALKSSRVLGVSNAEGIFIVELNIGDVLVFSSVGFQTIERTVTDNAQLTVMLKPSISKLDEVEVVMVNTGYQQMKANEMNGAIVHIDNKTLNLQTGTNILQRLDGITNGLIFNVGSNNYNNPQNKTNIVIRGHSTINGPLDPLIVLDDFVYEGDIENINPYDIESVTILKDASATSIYGARGGNGVIVLTSKKGKFNQPLKVNASASTIITAKPDLHYYAQMPSDVYIDVEEMLFNKGAFDGILNSETTPLTPAVEVFAKRKQGLISAADSAKMIGWLKDIDARDEYAKAFHHTAITQQYSVNITGGAEKSAWALAASYENAKNNFALAGTKTNVSINHMFRPFKNLTLGTNVYYTGRESKAGTVIDFNSLSRIGQRQSVPYVPVYDQSGAPLPFYRLYSKSFLDTAGGGLLQDWLYYPTEDPQYDYTKNQVQDINARINLTYQVWNDLSVQLSYNTDRQRSESKAVHEKESHYTRDLVNTFAQIYNTTKKVAYIVPIGDIIQRSQSSVQSQNIRSQINYHKRTGLHQVTAMAGFEAREVVTDGYSSSVYGYIDDPLSYQPVDYINSYPIRPYGTGSIGGAPNINVTRINRFVSWYGNFSYVFSDRYSVSGSMRKDGSNIYGVSTNDKWKPLWSIGAGYEISKEAFFDVPVISFLKLKATMGYSGNVDLRKSALPVAGFTTGAAANGGFPRGTIGTLNNPSLRWEQVRQFNFGADLGLFNNKVRGGISYYSKLSTDLYGPSLYDYTAWGLSNTLTKNVADMTGKGIDLDLQVKIIDRNLKWNSALIYNFNRSKTKKYYYNGSEDPVGRVLSSSGNTITPIEGMPLYAIAALRWGGLDEDGNPQGYLDGKLSTDYIGMIEVSSYNGEASGAVRYIGSAVPQHFGALRQELFYKGLSVAVNLTYKFGYYYRNSSISYTALINNGYGHADYLKRWQNPGDENKTNVPSFIYPNPSSYRDNFYTGSEILVERADHIRLQFINVGYQLNGKIRKKSINDITVYANLANLGIVWRANKSHVDPDYKGVVPPSRTVTLGLRLSL